MAFGNQSKIRPRGDNPEMFFTWKESPRTQFYAGLVWRVPS